MWSRLLALALLLLPAPALAGVKEKVAALAPSGLILVVDGKGNELVAQNADEPFVPASVTKIVTAWLAMEVLGGDYRFETRFYLDDKRVLYMRGGGDPFLISEESMQSRGVVTLRAVWPDCYSAFERQDISVGTIPAAYC